MSLGKARKLMARPSIRLLVPVIALLLCFCGILAYVMADSRRATLDRAAEASTSLIAALSSDIARNVETLDLSLQAVVDNLKNPEIDKIDPSLRQLVLFDRSATARHLGTILVLDEAGNTRFDSRKLNFPPLNFADRDYFIVHKNNDAVGTFIGQPERARVSGQSFIGISRRLSHPDGSFAGVVVASLRLSYFQELFRSAAIGPNGNITLARTDGTLIMRWPYKEEYLGLNLSKSVLYSHLAHSRSGIFETDARTDGVHRLIAYNQIGDLPLVLGVGQTTDDIYSDWRRDALAVSILLGLLCLLAVVLTMYLAREAETSNQLGNERDLAIDSMAQGLCMFDAEQKLIACNKKYAELYGLDEEHTERGTTLRAILEHRIRNNIVPEDHEHEVSEWLAEIASNRPFEFVQTLRDGRFISVVHRPTAEGGWVSTHEDVTDRQMSQARVEHMALHDALTGLGNRVALMERMDEACARCRRRGETFSLLLLDLDRFKQVNDTLGHPAGDALLREVAARLKASLRETDALVRLGGDEFAIIQAGETDQREASSKLAERIIAELCSPFCIEDNEVHIGASIGIALGPEHSINPDDLMKMSDMALYRAKESGRNCYRVFDIAMTDAMNRRHELESDLRHAIENDQLELHYQPIVDATTRRIRSAEALIRWQHPTKGMVMPDRFIPLAEETGLISQIGQWVLHTACVEAATWPTGVKLAVNLSAKQFGDPSLLDVVVCILAETGLPPERLEIEITETALIESAATVLPVLRRFKNLGITIALDDFGTGYSSLSQLTMFPFDKIKIDKSFTQKVTSRAECAAIISATMTLAHSLDKETTAEGVETVEQYKLLRLAGVTSLQGFLFKRPGPASDLDFDAVYGGPVKEAA
jgi:diguanylate cyclase (GGDEF)-like protein